MGRDQNLDAVLQSSLTALITDKIKLPEPGCEYFTIKNQSFLIKIIPLKKELKYTNR